MNEEQGAAGHASEQPSDPRYGREEVGLERLMRDLFHDDEASPDWFE
jgi:hypothetical protein